jgi:hypothetical protein
MSAVHGGPNCVLKIVVKTASAIYISRLVQTVLNISRLRHFFKDTDVGYVILYRFSPIMPPLSPYPGIGCSIIRLSQFSFIMDSGLDAHLC